MSILIKGMEMPKSCDVCRFAIDGFCYASGKVNVSAVEDRQVTNYCPLVPVPPHGRLIEWVSAKERLPEVGKSVLCACRANIYEVMKMRTDGAWVHNDAVYDSAYMGGFVTYWAELPTIIPAEEGE